MDTNTLFSIENAYKQAVEKEWQQFRTTQFIDIVDFEERAEKMKESLHKKRKEILESYLIKRPRFLNKTYLLIQAQLDEKIINLQSHHFPESMEEF